MGYDDWCCSGLCAGDVGFAARAVVSGMEGMEIEAMEVPVLVHLFGVGISPQCGDLSALCFNDAAQLTRAGQQEPLRSGGSGGSFLAF